MARELKTAQELRDVLANARVVAVLGANPDAARPAHYVPAYLQQQGMRIVPVSARFAGQTIHGATTLSTLREAASAVGVIDIVDVFRRSEDVLAHVPEVLAMEPLPRVVWLQSGIENDEAAAAFIAAGIDVVQDRCTLAEHRRLL